MPSVNKQCKACGKHLPLDSFSLNRKAGDGYQYSCKRCSAEYSRRYHQTHREQISKRRSAHYQTHRKELLDLAKTYYVANRETINAKRRTYEHRTKQLAWTLKWIAKNHETFLRWQKRINNRYRGGLHDVYVRELLRKQLQVERSAIPQTLVDAKRAHLRIKRLIKEKRK